MVSTLRTLGITLCSLIIPVAAFGFGVRVTQFSHVPISGDALLIILIALAALAGGASIFLIRVSLQRRIFTFFGYWMLASFVLFLLYPAIVCTATECP